VRQSQPRRHRHRQLAPTTRPIRSLIALVKSCRRDIRLDDDR
jgi:hypothetical protein